jgi:hypothetical protein
MGIPVEVEGSAKGSGTAHGKRLRRVIDKGSPIWFAWGVPSAFKMW